MWRVGWLSPIISIRAQLLLFMQMRISVFSLPQIGGCIYGLVTWQSRSEQIVTHYMTGIWSLRFIPERDLSHNQVEQTSTLSAATPTKYGSFLSLGYILCAGCVGLGIFFANLSSILNSFGSPQSIRALNVRISMLQALQFVEWKPNWVWKSCEWRCSQIRTRLGSKI